MGKKHGRKVEYDTSDHLSVLTSMYGSVWPKVIPYCLLNAGITAMVQIIYRSRLSSKLDLSNTTHGFMNLLVAFLIVSRVTISVSRYNEARGYLGTLMKETRELLQTMAVLTRRMHEPADKEWRNEVAYRQILLLKTAMAVVDYRSDKVPAWEIPELDPEETAQIKANLSVYFADVHSSIDARTEFDESMRVPLMMAYRLRCCLDTGEDRLSAKMDHLRSQKLFESVDSFMGTYYSLQKFLTTPFPFPLVQMTRTFLLFYIFTVPFALLSDISSPLMHIIVIFFLTYGFIGLELVSIELDDPFGDDPNDFNNAAMANSACEDVYLLMLSVDGKEWTEKLRAKLRKTKETQPTEQSPLRSEN